MWQVWRWPFLSPQPEPHTHPLAGVCGGWGGWGWGGHHHDVFPWFPLIPLLFLAFWVVLFLTVGRRWWRADRRSG